MVFRSEVEEWLYSIGLPHLYPYFVEDGYTTLDAVRHMRQSDIDSIVDRNGAMFVLNDEIDRLNYGDNGYQTTHLLQGGESAYYEQQPVEFETRESLISRYENRGVPAVGYASRLLARRSKSISRRNRATSLAPLVVRSASVIRYVPNSASEAYESLFAQKRATSLAAQSHREAQHAAAAAALDESRRRREDERIRRAKSATTEAPASDNLDRGRFRDHYTNDYVWIEKNHVNDVGVRYDGLSRKVDHKPSHWRCEDEIERGKEYKRMNDECADKIADNRYSIANSREWLVDQGGISDRVHLMSAKTLKTRYDLDSIKRNMDNLKAMRARLLKS
jgi:hypothetical protein